jgi:hypothetical protein
VLFDRLISLPSRRQRVVGRGVLLDVAAYKGTDPLPVDYWITVEDLQNTAKAENVEIRKGDILLVRTGWRKTWGEPDEAGRLDAAHTKWRLSTISILIIASADNHASAGYRVRRSVAPLRRADRGAPMVGLARKRLQRTSTDAILIIILVVTT